jgi:adenylate kinase
MRLVLLGLPGAGKGTQAKLLVARLGLTYIGTGDILRDAIARGTDLGRTVEPIIKQGLLAPDHIVNDVVAELFRSPKRPERFVTDGYPRTYAQVVAFDALLRQERVLLPLTAVINLTISDDEVERRMLGRGRPDDKAETIRQRLQEFHKNEDAIVEFYARQGLLKNVPAVGTPEDIYADIICALGLCDKQPDPNPERRKR